MNLEKLSKIKEELKNLIKDKEIYDLILFGSFVKGKESPNDIDLAIISNKKQIKLKNFHVSIISPEDFFKPISLIKTLLQEGYSLKKNKYFSEIYGFRNKCLFRYELSGLNASKKVMAVNFLKNKEKGLVVEKNGEWISNQVFLCPIKSEYIFEQFFINSKIKFKKFYCLID